MTSLDTQTAPGFRTLQSQTPTVAGTLGERLLRLTDILGGMDTRQERLKDPMLRAELTAIVEVTEKGLSRPAARSEIAAHLESLAVHHPELKRDDAAFRVWVNDWLADIGRFPEPIIAEACAAWRRNTNPFYPKPGQLLALAEPKLKTARSLLAIAKRALDEAAA